MKRPLTLTFVLAALFGSLAGVASFAQSQSSVKSANGIALSEFDGYASWPVIAPSRPDNAGGCGVAKDGCIKTILGNPTMMRAYREGFPANGKSVPDGAAIAKVEWHQRHAAAPYGVDVSDTLAGISFMIKDSTRFPQTNGWGYATFVYDVEGGSFKPSTDDPAVMRTSCHSCHTRFEKAHDFVFTRYATR